MALQSYTVGTRPIITATFTDEAGVVANPTGVTFMIQDPNGDITSVVSPNAAITNPVSGTWVYTFPTALPNLAGVWYVRVKGTGVVAAKEERFNVLPSRFAAP